MMALMTFLAKISSYWEETRRVQVSVSWGLNLERLVPNLATAHLPPGAPLHQELVALVPSPPCSSRCTLKGVHILSQTTLSPLSLLSQRWARPCCSPTSPDHSCCLLPWLGIILLVCAWLTKHWDNTAVLTFLHVRSPVPHDTKTKDMDDPTPPERQEWRACLFSLLSPPQMNRSPCSDLEM